ncbi:MAG: hypothetical protein HQM14_06455 [SAR324 cluster bacterium]|nr:hypothetical protein [SAR324 cluster bacterium]
MDRASRFIWELGCGRKDRKLFKRAIRAIKRVLRRTEDFTLLSDGEGGNGSINCAAGEGLF